MSETHVFILSGGSGTRLWPLSTSEKPKQFHRFAEKETLFEKSVKRAQSVAGDNVWIVTGRSFVNTIKNLVSGVPDSRILVEPSPKNTAGAIAWAIAASNVQDDDIMVIIPSDHYIEPEDVFVEQIEKLIELCRDKFIGLIGITPAEDNPSFGYIVPGEEIEANVFKVSLFKEKPDVNGARELIRRGALWNSGIFVMSVKQAKEALSQYSEPHAELLERAEKGGEITPLFQNLPSIQFDRAVLEKADNLIVIKARFAWFDLGTWDAVIKSGRLPGSESPVYISSSRSAKGISLDGRPVVIIGVDDVIVVSGEEGVLVVKKGKSADVREIVESIKKSQGGLT